MKHSEAMYLPTAVEFEHHGIEPIPEAERTATIADFLRIEWGGLNSFATALLGAFPIALGLNLYQGLAAITSGVILGAIILSPLGIFAPISGTNNAVSSSAHFGVVGRIVGSFLSLLTAVAFFSISVWSSGDAVVSAAHRALQVPSTNAVYACTYGLFILSVVAVCVYGFKLMLFVNKVAVVAASVLFLVGFAAFWSDVDFGYKGSGLSYGHPGFLPAFVSSALIAMANPISCGAFLGDWSRYLPSSASKRSIIGASFLAQILSLGAFAFGLMTASLIANRANQYLERLDYTGGLIAIAPSWLCGPLLALAVVSGMSTGTTSLYGTGLDFSSIFPSLSRPKATLLVGAISAALIYIGRFTFNLIDSISAFATLIVVATTPWMVIMTIGYLNRRGYYLPDAMQVFNRGQRGGPYWFTSGWNLPGCASWFISSVLALLTVNVPEHFVGPLGHLVGDVDLSIAVAVVLPMFIYPLLLYVFPEPLMIFGPGGPLLSRATARAIEPIVTDGRRIAPTRSDAPALPQER